MKKLVCCLLFALAACAGDTDQAQEPTETEEATASPAAQMEECEDKTPPAPEKVSDKPEDKPEVEVPDGAPPCELVIQDIYEGTGTESKESDTVTAHYVGVSWSTG